MQLRKRYHRRTIRLFHRDVHSPTHDIHRFGVVVPRSFTIG